MKANPASVPCSLVSGLLVLGLAACTGVTGADRMASDDEPGADGVPDAPRIDDDAPLPADEELPAFDPGEGPLRRLTNQQYQNTLRAVLGIEVPDTLIQDRSLDGFANGPHQADPSSGLSQMYAKAAFALAELTTAPSHRERLFDATTCGDRDACLESFVDRFGARLFRRPLGEDERAALLESGRAEATVGNDFWQGARIALEIMLQSVPFLYVVDEGGDIDPDTGLLRRSPHALATRLSLLLWNSGPDDALLDRAAEGALTTLDDITAESRRMMEDERFVAAARHFFREWLGYDFATTASKEASYVDYKPELVSSLVAETDRLVDHFVSQDLPIMDIFAADFSFADDRVRAFYGADEVDPDDESRVRLPAARRGILSHASFIAANSGPGRQSPTTRGLGILRRFMCGEVGSPPPDAPAELPEPEDDEPLTIRERTERFMLGNDNCNYCHVHMDGVGFLFEHFDSIGKHRDSEDVPGAGPKPVDATSSIPLWELDEVQGLPGLAEALSTRPEALDCLTNHLFRRAAGRHEELGDARTLADMKRSLAARGGSFRAALRGLVESGAVQFMKAPE